MKKFRIPIIISVVAIVAIGVLLFLQRNNQANSNEGEITVDESGVYIEGLIGNVERLNPVLSYYNEVDSAINKLVYSSLFKQSSEGYPVGDLVESWGVSVDGLEYNFKLRDGVQWHDGQPLTTNDVIFTIQTMMGADSFAPQDIKDLWNAVEIKQFDEQSFKLKLSSPYAPFVDFLNFGILPYHIYGSMSYAEILTQETNFVPVGSGPYKVDQLSLENGVIKGVELVANENYYLGEAHIKNFNFRLFDDEAQLLDAYKNNLINGFLASNPDIFDAAKDDINMQMYTEILPVLNLAVFNLDNSDVLFFQDSEIREALLMAVNREWIVNQILGNRAIVADSPIFPDVWAYVSDMLDHEYDPEGAVKMLQEKEYTFADTNATVRSKDGISMAFTLIYPDDMPVYAEIATYLQECWAGIGVSVTLEAMDFNDMVNTKLLTRDFEAALLAYDMRKYPDPDPYMFWNQTQAKTGQNYSVWNNRLASEYLEQARVTTDTDTRRDLYERFQTHFSHEVPAMLLYYPTVSYNVSVNIKGVQIGSLYDLTNRFNYVNEWYFEDTEVLAP